jgi:hypothetical protein
MGGGGTSVIDEVDERLDEVDQRLKAWVASVVGDVAVSLKAPTASATGSCIGLYLIEVLPGSQPHGGTAPPLTITLRYLVTACAPEPEAAHRLIGELLFAAMADTHFEVETAAPAPSIWAAFGMPPQPAFVLRTPLQRKRPQKVAPLVLSPLEMKASPLRALHGIVLGPRDTPVAGARVEVPALGLSASTDATGRFRFRAVPGGPGTITLRIIAKGREWFHTPPAGEGSDRPLIIHYNPMEV